MFHIFCTFPFFVKLWILSQYFCIKFFTFGSDSVNSSFSKSSCLSDFTEHLKYFFFIAGGSSKDLSFAGGASIKEVAALLETVGESFVTDKTAVCLHSWYLILSALFNFLLHFGH